MKTKQLLAAMLMASAILQTETTLAQGKGNAKGNDKQEWRKDDRNPRANDNRFEDRTDNRNNWNYRDYHHDTRWDDRYKRVPHDRNRQSNRHNYHRPPHWAPSHGHYKQSRYVYYRNYNVYYDCYLGQFITFSGRNYIYSYHMPPHLRRANFDRIVFVDLDYYDDDLPKYLDRRRGSVSVSVNGRF